MDKKLNQVLMDAISQIQPAMVATSNRAGEPNVSPKGSLRVLDDNHVAFADLRSPQTISNLRENPNLQIIGFDPVSRKGWRIWGVAEEILTAGDLYDRFSAPYAGRSKVNHVVKVLVKKGILL
jgi:uncharacterized protein